MTDVSCSNTTNFTFIITRKIGNERRQAFPINLHYWNGQIRMGLKIRQDDFNKRGNRLEDIDRH